MAGGCADALSLADQLGEGLLGARAEVLAEARGRRRGRRRDPVAVDVDADVEAPFVHVERRRVVVRGVVGAADDVGGEPAVRLDVLHQERGVLARAELRRRHHLVDRPVVPGDVADQVAEPGVAVDAGRLAGDPDRLRSNLIGGIKRLPIRFKAKPAAGRA